MIIKICGTSGSGKSTAMRQAMERLGKWNSHYVSGRKRPLYYSNEERPRLIVLGHYEIDCGGCDTIGSAPKIYEAIQALPTFDVLLTEGLLWSEDVKWTLALREKHEVVSLFLVTDVEECIRRVGIRQAGKEPANAERLKNKLVSRAAQIDRARLRLIASGIDCRRCSSRQAPEIILRIINNAQQR